MNRNLFIKTLAATAASLCLAPEALAKEAYIASKYEARKHPYYGVVYILNKKSPRRDVEFNSPEFQEFMDTGKQDGLNLHCQYVFPQGAEIEIGCEFYK